MATLYLEYLRETKGLFCDKHYLIYIYFIIIINFY